jgi:hypothetical protein
MAARPTALPSPIATARARLRAPQGVALQADSKFPVIRAAYPFVAAKLLTDPSPRLQRALLDLLRKRRGRGGAAHLVQLVSILDHALSVSDPLTLTERLAQIYLIPEHAPLVRELMDQAIDMLDFLSTRAPEVADRVIGANDTPTPGETAAEAELRRTALAVQKAVRGAREVLGELASGSPVALSRAQRLMRALLAEPMGQQFVLEFGLKLGERATVRSAGLLLEWPENQLPGAHHRMNMDETPDLPARGEAAATRSV